MENDASEDRERLKEEIKSELEHDARRKRNIRGLGCLAVFMLLVGIPALLAASALAKTGLVHVPLLTPWLFKPAQPTRVVRPAPDDAAQVVRKAAYAAKFDPSSRLVTLRLTEEELTTIVADALRASALPVKVGRVQTAALEGRIEVFATISTSRRETTFLATLSPAIENGALRLKLGGITIGSFIVPQALVALAEKKAEEAAGKSYRASLAAVGELAAIDISDGAIAFSFNPVNP